LLATFGVFSLFLSGKDFCRSDPQNIEKFRALEINNPKFEILIRFMSQPTLQPIF
jgi:hypothetical protein